MFYLNTAFGLLVTVPFFGPAATAAHAGLMETLPMPPLTAALSPAIELPSPALTPLDVDPTPRLAPAPVAQPAIPICADFDKRRQLRGRVAPAVVRTARSLLNLPLGAGRFVSVEGNQYAFCLEPHYHPPGFSRGPVGWHKGVTVYDAADLAG
jgi:hypothetical protein